MRALKGLRGCTALLDQEMCRHRDQRCSQALEIINVDRGNLCWVSALKPVVIT